MGDIDRGDEMEHGGEVHDVLGEEVLVVGAVEVEGTGIEGRGQDKTQANH